MHCHDDCPQFQQPISNMVHCRSLDNSMFITAVDWFILYAAVKGHSGSSLDQWHVTNSDPIYIRRSCSATKQLNRMQHCAAALSLVELLVV